MKCFDAVNQNKMKNNSVVNIIRLIKNNVTYKKLPQLSKNMIIVSKASDLSIRRATNVGEE